MTNFKDLGELFGPCDRLPEIGQRVRCVVIKEMIYQGNDEKNGYNWLDDGEGERIIIFCEESKKCQEKESDIKE